MPTDAELLAENAALEKGSASPSAPAEAKSQAWEVGKDPMSLGLDAPMAAIEGALSNIPMIKAGQAKLAHVFGVPEQATAQEQARLQHEYPGADLAGNIGGAIGAGELVGAGKAVGLAAKGISALKSGALVGALQPIYKLGETANQAQVQGSPLRIEQLGHALIPDWDTLKAAGIAMLFHMPGIAVEGAGLATKAVAARSAGRYVKDAAEELTNSRGAGYEAKDLGKKILDEDLVSPGKLEAKLRSNGALIEDAAASTPVDSVARSKFAAALDETTAKVQNTTLLQPALRKIQAQARKLESGNALGDEIEGIIRGYKAEARKEGGNGEVQRLYGDAAQMLRQEFSKHMSMVRPEVADQYTDAVANYEAYSKMSGGIGRLAENTATGTDVALSAAKLAATEGIASVVPGTVGKAAVNAVALAAGIKGSKNYANLANKFVSNPPLANFMRNSDALLNHLMGKPSSLLVAKAMSSDEVNKRYDEVTNGCRAAAGNMDAVTLDLRSKLDFLPQHEGDALVAKTADKLQDSAAQIPASDQPPTAFGIQTGPSDREKRQFLAKFDAKFDPFKAIWSGNSELIQEADRHNPEIMQQIRRQLLERCAEKNVPYSTKRRISAILGVAGVPTQDPLLAAKLQQCIQGARQADTQQGQMDSARQQNAMLKNNQATMTRANSIAGSLNGE